MDPTVQLQGFYDARADHGWGGVMTGNTVIVTDATFEDDVLRAGLETGAAHAVLSDPGGGS